MLRRSDTDILSPTFGQPWSQAVIAAYWLGINRRARDRALGAARTSSGVWREVHLVEARHRQRMVIQDLQLLRKVSTELRQ